MSNLEDSEIINKHLPTFKKHFVSLNLKWANLPLNHKTIFKLLPLFLIAAAIPITVNLSQKAQNLGSNAASNCSTSLQSQINSAPSSGTVDITGCTFYEGVTISKPLTLVGGKIDGQNSRATAIRISSSDVTINGTEVLNSTNQEQQGAIDSDNMNRIKLINVHSHNNRGPGISLSGGSGHRIIGGELDHNFQSGYHMTGVSDVIMDGVKVDYNNPQLNYNPGLPHTIQVSGKSGWYWPSDPFWEGGAGKITRSNGVIIQNCIVNNNGGVGIWFDIDGNNTKIQNNYVYNNDLSGIMFEISKDAVIANNKVWNNGYGDLRGWGWPANILISSTRNVETYGNIVGTGATGISLISQNRENGYTAMSGMYVHDNTILAHSGKLIGWYDDHNGGSFNDTSNRGSGGMYEVDGSKFEWNGSTTNLSGYNATRGDEGGRIISSTEVSQAKAQLTAPSTLTTPTPTQGQGPTPTPTTAPTLTPVPTSANQVRSPYPQGSSAKQIPGLIQAENYDQGGENLAYHDTDSGNNGAVYRNDNVDIKPSTDTNGGYTIGWFAAGEYLTYSVNVAQTNLYDIQFRVGSQLAGRTFHLEVDGTNVTGKLNVPQLANWDQYQTVIYPKVSLNQGAHIIKVVNDGADFLDFNWINFIVSTTPTLTPTATLTPTPTKTPLPTVTFAPESNIQVLAVSSFNNRSNPTNLLGANLNGRKYIFVANDSGVKKVRFWLDNKLMTGSPRQTENTSPFDFAGTAKGGSSLSFDTQMIANGTHNVTASVDTTNGSFVLSADFKVNNSTPTPNGLSGAYYLTRNLSDTPLYRIDPTIAFDWGSSSPMSTIPNDNFSVRWTGFIIPKYSETYTIYASVDDGVRVWVNNVLIIDQWHTWNSPEYSGKISLIANQKYSIKVEYYEQGGSAVAGLKWSSPSTAKSFIPQSQLYLY